jgi:Late exocytosis, associated with Golgi transport
MDGSLSLSSVFVDVGVGVDGTENDHVNSTIINSLQKDIVFLFHRFLEEDDADTNNTSSTTTNSTTTPTATESYNDAVTIRNTLRIYGTLFVVIILVFSYLRQKFPRLYNIRSWVEHIQTPLADRQFGYLSWMYKVYLVTDAEMLDECGMDALCYARVLEFGIRLSVMGMVSFVFDDDDECVFGFA